MSVNEFLEPGYTPPTDFYFSVTFIGINSIDSSFQEVSGLKATFELEETKEGGENSFVQRIPKPPKFSNLVLKRCLLPSSKLDNWCRDAINDFRFSPRDIHISLMSAGDNKVLASWNVIHAFPVSWELSSLNSSSNALAIETLTLNYRYFKREI